MNAPWFTYYEARPRWRSALFPRFPKRVSEGWVYIAFGAIFAGIFDNLDGPVGFLLWLAAFAVEVYGAIRTIRED